MRRRRNNRARAEWCWMASGACVTYRSRRVHEDQTIKHSLTFCFFPKTHQLNRSGENEAQSHSLRRRCSGAATSSLSWAPMRTRSATVAGNVRNGRRRQCAGAVDVWAPRASLANWLTLRLLAALPLCALVNGQPPERATDGGAPTTAPPFRSPPLWVTGWVGKDAPLQIRVRVCVCVCVCVCMKRQTS